MTTLIHDGGPDGLLMALGWTLVHFVWQAGILGLIVWVVLPCLRSCKPNLRYLVLCAGLAAMIVSPMITFGFTLASQTETPLTHLDPARWPIDATSLNDGPEERLSSPVITTAPESPAPLDSPEATTAIERGVLAGWTHWIRSNETSILPWCIGLWIVGVFLLALRLILGLVRVNRWRDSASAVGQPEVLSIFDRLKATMKIASGAPLVQSPMVVIPTVIGWFKPVVFLPASLACNLTTSEIEAILAHELAHIRRHDYLVNICQMVAETVLFYHPAVWWISHQIRIEREHCCDDIAVTVCGSRYAFASALANVESLAQSPENLLVAANGGSLVDRIRRITLGDPRLAPRWPAGLVTLIGLSLVTGALWATNGQPADPPLADPVNARTAVPVTDDPPPKITEPTIQTTTPQKDDLLVKAEVKRVDSKTGIEKRVYEGIRLTAGKDDAKKTSQAAMMYSNVMQYTFITRSVAKRLGAVRLGTIDFGESAPPKGKTFQSGVFPMPKPVPKKQTDDEPKKKTTTVKQIEQSGDSEIVPYEDDPIWVPGHLGFYGLNQTKQHQFDVVRIETFDLGIGVPFGPINVLVLNDENSDFGVLGRNATKRIRGKKRETLWWYADGTFHLIARSKAPRQSIVPSDTPPEKKGEKPTTAPPIRKPGQIKVTSSRPEPPRVDLDELKPDVKRIKTHHYSMASRASTDWVAVKGVRIPVDAGVEHAGVIAYVTLMSDIVAVDATTQKTLWNIPWGKTQPIWRSISVIQWEHENAKKLAVEVFAMNNKTREFTFRYFDLQTGQRIESLNKIDLAHRKLPPRDEQPRPQTDSGPGDEDPGKPKIKSKGKQQEEGFDTNQPWTVFGNVTDAKGKPIDGATVKAHCGIGSLHQTGSATTDAEGNYKFQFGPGMWFDNKSMIQAATISVSLDGHFEKNLHRQGDLVATFVLPESDIGWGGKKKGDVFLPGKPKRIDFVMVPASRLRGLVVVSATGKRPAGLRISLRGKDMPPSSSVVVQTTTDQDGRFEFDNIPTGFAYQIVIEPADAKAPRIAWASPPITFHKNNVGHTRIQHTIDGIESNFNFAQLFITLNGEGDNRKTAMKTAAAKQLELKWDGLSSHDNKFVSARSASISLGE